MQLGLPELGAHLFYFRIAESVKTPHIRDDVLLFPNQIFNTFFDLLPYFFWKITLFNSKRSIHKIDKRKIRDVLAIRIGVSLSPLNLFKIQGRLKLLNEPALPRAGIATNRDNRSITFFQFIYCLFEVAHFHLPADEIRSQAGEAVYLNWSLLYGHHFVNLYRLSLAFDLGWFQLFEIKMPFSLAESVQGDKYLSRLGEFR